MAYRTKDGGIVTDVEAIGFEWLSTNTKLNAYNACQLCCTIPTMRSYKAVDNLLLKSTTYRSRI